MRGGTSHKAKVFRLYESGQGPVKPNHAVKLPSDILGTTQADAQDSLLTE
jgi:hypothetical protein